MACMIWIVYLSTWMTMIVTCAPISELLVIYCLTSWATNLYIYMMRYTICSYISIKRKDCAGSEYGCFHTGFGGIVSNLGQRHAWRNRRFPMLITKRIASFPSSRLPPQSHSHSSSASRARVGGLVSPHWPTLGVKHIYTPPKLPCRQNFHNWQLFNCNHLEA